MFLATDLDGTFLGGSHAHRKQLYDLLRNRDGVMVAFVTGRGLASVIPLLQDNDLPRPHYIICDVGATIVNGRTFEPVEPLQHEIEEKWPGHLAVKEQLKDLNLVYQEVPQERRCSFFTNDPALIDEVTKQMKDLGCDVLSSANKFLDVLPSGVNKGTTLTNLIQLLSIDTNKVLVAGDTLNDLAMYHCGFKSVVVGNAEQKLLEATQSLKDVFHAKEEGAGGIIESMHHFDQFATYCK